MVRFGPEEDEDAVEEDLSGLREIRDDFLDVLILNILLLLLGEVLKVLQ